MLAIDVYYYNEIGKVVGLLFKEFTDSKPINIVQKEIQDIALYEPGAFYKRELPCIISLLSEVNISEIELIIIDGYVFLDDEGKMGLGAYLYNYLSQKIPIIGVAKTSFHDNTKNVIEVFRGTSTKPLYVSSIGIHIQEAATFIKSMFGNNRIPTLLKLLDSETKIVNSI